GLRLTEASRAVLRGEATVMLRKEAPHKRDRERPARDGTVEAALSPADASLFEQLRALRARLAREQNVPAYVIFHDSTLREIATLRPATSTELAAIGGIGGSKLTRYGEQVLQALRAGAAESA